MKKDVSSFALFDPAFACDGLFVPRSQKGWALYDVRKQFDRGEIIFEGVQLTAAHQSVLLAVCARTGRHGLDVVGTKNDPRAKQSTLNLSSLAPNIREERDPLDDLFDMIFEDLEAGEAASKNMASVEVTAFGLMADADLDHGGKGYARMVTLLRQLSSVSVYRSVGKRGATSRLISFKHDGDRLKVLVNWRLASAILGAGQFAQISLYERKDLTTSAAKILHAWLCCHLRLGQSFMKGQGVKLDTLIPHVWGKRPASSKQAHRKRRMALREALEQIGSLGGWVATEDRNTGLYHISRPKELYTHEPVEKWLPTPGAYVEEVDE
jgi:hypothetical protein